MSEKVTRVTPKKEQTETEKIVALIEKKNGNISAVARSLKLSRKTIYEKINADEVLQDALFDSREKLLDDSEDKLGAAVRKGAAWAVCFTLKTVGKKRGYVERVEQTGANGGAIKIEQSNQDLSKLSTDELLALKQIQEKLNAA